MTKRDLHENWNEPKTVTLTYGACYHLKGFVQEQIDRLEQRKAAIKVWDEGMKNFHKENKLPTDSAKNLRKNIQYLKAIKKALE
jgi:predicted solute-binding protein